MVGSANGMSISTSSTDLPQKRSRTRTQAMSGPITTLTAVTPAAVKTVSLMAAAVWPLVMVVQKTSQPPSMAVTTTAARGIRTSALNQIMAMPSPSPDDRVSVERGPDRRGVLAGRTAAISVEVMRDVVVSGRRRSLEGQAGAEDGLEDQA